VVKAKASPEEGEKKAEETVDQEEESEEELEEGDEDDVEEYENWNYFPGLGESNRLAAAILLSLSQSVVRV
jgi:hypothetical protein